MDSICNWPSPSHRRGFYGKQRMATATPLLVRGMDWNNHNDRCNVLGVRAMKVSYTVYGEDDEIIKGGVCSIIEAPIIMTTELVRGNIIVLEGINVDE